MPKQRMSRAIQGKASHQVWEVDLVAAGSREGVGVEVPGLGSGSGARLLDRPHPPHLPPPPTTHPGESPPLWGTNSIPWCGPRQGRSWRQVCRGVRWERAGTLPSCRLQWVMVSAPRGCPGSPPQTPSELGGLRVGSVAGMPGLRPAWARSAICRPHGKARAGASPRPHLPAPYPGGEGPDGPQASPSPGLEVLAPPLTNV